MHRRRVLSSCIARRRQIRNWCRHHWRHSIGRTMADRPQPRRERRGLRPEQRSLIGRRIRTTEGAALSWRFSTNVLTLNVDGPFSFPDYGLAMERAWVHPPDAVRLGRRLGWQKQQKRHRPTLLTNASDGFAFQCACRGVCSAACGRHSRRLRPVPASALRTTKPRAARPGSPARGSS
jgi:hypothetical protein